MVESITTEATEAGKNCALCDWFEIGMSSVGWYDYEIEIECTRHSVEWYTDLTPKKGTDHPTGKAICPEYEDKEEAVAARAAKYEKENINDKI